MVKIQKLILVLFLLGSCPFFANAANLSVSPVSGTLEVGDKIVIQVLVLSRTPINAISGVLNIPTSLFTVESVSKSGSVLNFWVTEPNFSKGAGVLSFEGVALGGFAEGTKAVVTATLRAVAPGTGHLTFKSGQILANDGAGTDLTDLLTGATFAVNKATPKTIIPKPKLEPEPEPELAPEIPQPEPTLKAPEIMLGMKYGIPAILGTSDYEKAQVLITFVTQNGTKVFILGVADVDGSFNVLVPNSLRRGTYNVTAVMIKEDKTNSQISNTIVVKVGSIISDISWEIRLFIILLILAIIYLILRTHAHFLGDKTDRNFPNKHKLHEAEDILHKSFDILREDIDKYEDEEDLNIKEHKRISSIKKDITDAEKVIDKTIKDIES